MNDLKKHYEDTSVSTPHKRTAILAKETQLFKFVVSRHMWKVSSFISIGIVDMCTFVNKNKNR